MDSSITRRGQPCWYRVEGVGLMAINDSLLLEGAIYQMIRSHFRDQPYYIDLLDIFHEVRPPAFWRIPTTNPRNRVSTFLR
jgi:farnesyl diphosphate synthase